MRTLAYLTTSLGFVTLLAIAPACGETTSIGIGADGTEAGDRGTAEDGSQCESDAVCASNWCSPAGVCAPAPSDDGKKNGLETDVDCGGPAAPKCGLDKACAVDRDCEVACNHAGRCIDAPSCKPHLGGDTCGTGEVGSPEAVHESCCRSLPVPGYEDPAHPGKTVYLDKYEITAGRVRAFLEAMRAASGKPDVRGWIAAHRPAIWDPSWEKFLPSDDEGDAIVVDRRLLGDRRPGPDNPPIPDEDQPRRTGVDYQFNGSLFVYLHGNNCSTHAPDAYGFPTWFYPAATLAKYGPAYPPRADGTTPAGITIPASEHLDVKAMNCITHAMLAAFCAWDGGQLATDDVLDFVTDSPASLGQRPGCGTQIGTENPPRSDRATTGGRCADLDRINATYDAGGMLPEPNHPLNANNYVFPYFAPGTSHDKAWQIAAPGRGTEAAGGRQVDQVRIEESDEPWVDLAGNLVEAALVMEDGRFTGRFGIKYRGIGYQSARSELNTRDDWEGEGGIPRIARPEAKAAFFGGRCMRFR